MKKKEQSQWQSRLGISSTVTVREVWPTCRLRPDLTRTISPSSLQKSVVQQLDSPGRGHPVCAGRPPHSAAGPQLHQPHHRGSLQGPQGPAQSVSTGPASPCPLHPSPTHRPVTAAPRRPILRRGSDARGAPLAHMLAISPVFVICDLLGSDGSA